MSDRFSLESSVADLNDLSVKTNSEGIGESIAIVKIKYDCGCNIGEIFSNVKYGSSFGPQYTGEKPMSDYNNWEAHAVTDDEKEIIIIMSINEGNFDSVQAYDSEIFSAGPMQKTVNSEGNGQFADLVYMFKEKRPEIYKEIFEDCGWIIEGDAKKNTLFYKNYEVTSGKKITGSELKEKLRDSTVYNKSNHKKGKNFQSKPLATIVKALRNKYFIEIQIDDFVSQLHSVLEKKITPGNLVFKIKEVIRSNLGKATVLDHYVNRPAYVAPDLESSLTALVNNKKIPSADVNLWEVKHAEYEQILLDHYGNNRRGTDMPKRYRNLKLKIK